MKYADRIRETTTTTGTGTLNLGGAVSGFRSFVEGVGTGAVVYYLITNRDSPEWEIGVGTVTDATPDTLSRSRIIASSNSGNAISFSAGTKDVRLVHPANVIDGASQLAPSVRVATTTSGTLSSSFENGDTVDGVTLATGDRILIKNQSTASENGIYIVAASGSPSRASDMFTGSNVSGTIVGVQAGTTNAGRLFVCTNAAGSDIVGTSSLTFTSPAAAATHASQHQHGGADEIATATPGANAIPKAGAGGTLASGWIPDLSGTYATASHNQASSTITDFAEAVDDRVASLLVAGSNVTLTYNDGAGTLTIAATGGGGGGGSELTDTSVKTSNYTAASGERVLVDPSALTAGDMTITLPSTAAPCAVVLVSNAASRWNVLIGRNGNTINGLTDTTPFSMQYQGQLAQFRPGSSGYVGQLINPPNRMSSYDITSSGYYTLSNSSAINITGALTICAWIRIFPGGNQTIYGGFNAGSPYNGFGFSVGGGTGVDRLEFWDGSAWRAGTGPVRGKWTHVAAVHTGTSAVIFYIDGRIDNSTTASALSSYTGSKGIGAYPSGASPFGGLIQDLRLYSSALSTENIRSIYNNGRGRPINDFANLVAWYLGSEGSGSTAVDRISANNGTIVGTATWGPGIISL